MGAPPTDEAISGPVFLTAGGGWTRAEFAIDALSLTGLSGDVNTLLSNVTALRIVNNPVAGFPGPPVVAVLGVDNIAAEVPEPSTGALGIAGFVAVLLRTRRD